MTIGVICDIPQEWAHLRSVLAGPGRQHVAHTTFDSGELDGHRVVLAATGMGKVNAGLVATLLPTERLGYPVAPATGCTRIWAASPWRCKAVRRQGSARPSVCRGW
ncbi:5'-methylthioadenosine/S-adenosylhomocysteine nucleosidase [Mycobacterium shigaense]|uniref:5'-methylthioadenosine/S-adenosylhomocysteine nucleosidase n=1 Tax=Mycobacterium shigaense TaxID=722731 RepID=A0A1Z4EBN3_9MYCO|nr:5'-methylthioadenosine/S-adenosylhomocysteine nucleosidase [Mycobacterium shigaense]